MEIFLMINNIIIKLNKSENLGELEKSISNFILHNLQNIENIDIRDLAKKNNCSMSSISRYVKKMGYKNFSEFKYDIKRYNTLLQSNKTDKEIEIEEQSFETLKYLEYIQDNIKYIIKSNDFFKIKEEIIKCSKIFIFANGGTYSLAYDLMIKLQRIGINAYASNDYVVQETLVSANEKDRNVLYFIISSTGETSNLSLVAKKINESKSTLISLTGNSNNKIARLSKINLVCADTEDELKNLIGNNRMMFLLITNLLFENVVKEKSEIYIKAILETSR
ncbi:hypothetical protein CG009_01595 [Mesoplasma florum]|nr:hypothetical protein CG009_01595 [Mesoplasma florum]